MANKLFLVLNLSLFALTSFSSAKNVPTCLDEDGEPVDWFIVYKLPMIPNGDLFKSGLAHIYITSSNVKDSTAGADMDDPDSDVFLETFKGLLHGNLKFSRRLTKNQLQASFNLHSKKAGKQKKLPISDDFYWTISAKPITDPKSLILRTLAVAYDKKNSATLNSIFYNDAPADEGEENGTKSNTLRAHAKGAILMDEVTGDSVWISHSTPKFPPPREMELKFKENFIKNGQTFMCISYNLGESGPQIINHLVNMNPLVYDSVLSDKMFQLIPELEDLKLKGELRRRKKTEVTTLAQTIKTRAGVELQIYSKSPDFDGDMYSQWINSELDSSLLVSTWRNGGGNPLDSYCPKNSLHVNNVQGMKLDVRDMELSWPYSVDHSKWAISDSKDSGYVCIADINRMQSQFKRGGGAICFSSPSCWSLFSNLISDVEPCPLKF